VSQEKRDLANGLRRFNRYANRKNLLSGHAQFKLSLDRPCTLVDQVQRFVAARWRPPPGGDQGPALNVAGLRPPVATQLRRAPFAATVRLPAASRALSEPKRVSDPL